MAKLSAKGNGQEKWRATLERDYSGAGETCTIKTVYVYFADNQKLLVGGGAGRYTVAKTKLNEEQLIRVLKGKGFVFTSKGGI